MSTIFEDICLLWHSYFIIHAVLLEKLFTLQSVKKFPAFYANRMFITAVTGASQLSLSWARSIQSIPSHSASTKSTLILPSHLRLGLPSGLFQVSTPNTVHASPLPLHATSPAYLILFYFIKRKILGEKYRSLSSSLCIFLTFPVNSSPLGTNILLNTQFSNTCNLPSSHNAQKIFTLKQNNRQNYSSVNFNL